MIYTHIIPANLDNNVFVKLLANDKLEGREVVKENIIG